MTIYTRFGSEVKIKSALKDQDERIWATAEYIDGSKEFEVALWDLKADDGLKEIMQAIYAVNPELDETRPQPQTSTPAPDLTARFTPKQREVWQALVDYVNGTGKRFYVSVDPHQIGSVLIAPRYGEKISHTTLKALERAGLITMPYETNNGFSLTDTGRAAIRATIAVK